ncbi:aminodeoxychorismate synthase component I [Epibacterium sp. SM1979]|uniref:Aminodeoxychorismate synthase component I n=1 Tax=Tritonibacter litoralis TaxID=2662264 RepID=A0A843YGP8_9RHOB|nr:aminodeoxychorismate synthase component I [Tritonibacter litoralis]MQQ07947.1 aminodeoxychorismate synthase component I [Tritonibacter litoralis]
MKLRFDSGPLGQGSLFEAPRDVFCAWSPDEVWDVLAALDHARQAGKWVAGYASYELGYVLEPKLGRRLPPKRALPLLRFGAYDAPRAPAPLPSAAPAMSPLMPRWDQDRYTQAFSVVKDMIGRGDIYQANLTFPIDCTAPEDASAIYGALVAQQPVHHGVLVEQAELPTLLSRSPELFFKTFADGRIQTRPMKGTQPRSADDQEDARRKAFLTADEKNRAENLMIVDLLRNDISRVAQPGTVSVPELFHVESYATVHQMVSTVEAQLQPGVGLRDIFAALYPCGSITGAPKIRAMEVLAELEPWPREIYCGTIGWAAPDGRSEFNVAIRTLMMNEGRATLNVGGGVVWDSTAASEYEEALWKARFADLSTTSRTQNSN